MTDKEYQEQKKRIKKYIDKWFQAMGLGWFKVDMEWSRERDLDNPQTAARTTTRWQYRHAVITWYVPALVDNDDEYLEGIVVHEFVHILVAPLLAVDSQDDLPLQHEYATECIARSMMWVREAGEKSATKKEP